MRFGAITLPNEPWDALADRWRALDEQGWDAVYVADHLGNPYAPEQPWLDAWSCLGAMALTVERARIGPLVTPITFRNPAPLARAALTVDTASGGRLDLAVGAGGSTFDHGLAQVEEWVPRERADRLERSSAARSSCSPTNRSRPGPCTAGSRSRWAARATACSGSRPSSPTAGTRTAAAA